MIVIVMSVAIGIFILIFLYAGVPLIHAKLSRAMLKRKVTASNAIVLTFDDGPGNRLTPAILDILDENNAKATFFPLGINIAGREEIVRQVKERGHEICSHGYEHLHHWKVSPFRTLSDIKRGWVTIDSVLGIKRKKYPFRPPYGKLNIFSMLYLLAHQVPIVYWLADSGDTWRSKPDGQRISLLAKKGGGTVSLAHDFDRSDDSVDQQVLETTRLALGMAKEENMRILTVSELLTNSK